MFLIMALIGRITRVCYSATDLPVGHLAGRLRGGFNQWKCRAEQRAQRRAGGDRIGYPEGQMVCFRVVCALAEALLQSPAVSGKIRDFSVHPQRVGNGDEHGSH